jgi:signal transduction histidine kinase
MPPAAAPRETACSGTQRGFAPVPHKLDDHATNFAVGLRCRRRIGTNGVRLFSAISPLDSTDLALQNPRRLAALAQSGLEPGRRPTEVDAFDRLSALTAKVLRVPVALVSLVDDNRQVFQGMHGPLPEPVLEVRETPLSHSFCQHVVASGKPLVVQDARADERVRENLAVRDLHVAAYLGVPLSTSEGYVLGSLCAIDVVPRQWTDDEMEILHGLASLATTELELRRSGHKMEGILTQASENTDSREDQTHLLVHDLRTPLNSLLLGLQTLPLLGNLNEDQIEALNLANRGGQTLLALVDDMLDLSSAEVTGHTGASTLFLEEFHPGESLEAAQRQVASLARERGIRLIVNSPPPEVLPVTLTADRDKLVRVLVNLLGNAIKFTPANGIVTATVRLSEDDGPLVFTVRDTGRGIAPEDIARIFERFVSIGRNADGRGGRSSGLGLAFCKMVAQAHGGSIEAKSELGQGSTFILRLPRSRPA